jgi:hypothetical protein
MAKLENLTIGALVDGIIEKTAVEIITAKWHGDSAVEITYKIPETGQPNNILLYRDDEYKFEITEEGRPWGFDADGSLFRLISEAVRIRLAYLFDPLLAVHTSLVEPLPHQITAVYEEMLTRQPLRFLLADDPGLLCSHPTRPIADRETARPKRPVMLLWIAGEMGLESIGTP